MAAITLYLEDALHARAKRLAERERRSLTAQVSWLLERALDAPGAPGAAAVGTVKPAAEAAEAAEAVGEGAP